MRKFLFFVGAVAGAAWLAQRAIARRILPAYEGPAPRAPIAQEDDCWPLEPPRNDAGVLGALAMFDEHVIAGAEAALNRPVGETVQGLASMLRERHREHLAHTRALLERLELQLELDPAVAEIEALCFNRRTDLAGVVDQDFEAAYAADVVDDHERMLQYIDEALLPAAYDERVIEHVRAARAHLAEHLAEARMLA